MSYGDAQLALIQSQRSAARARAKCSLKQAGRAAVDATRERPLAAAAAIAAGATAAVVAVGPARRVAPSVLRRLIGAALSLLRLKGTLSALVGLPKELSRRAKGSLPASSGAR